MSGAFVVIAKVIRKCTAIMTNRNKAAGIMPHETIIMEFVDGDNTYFSLRARGEMFFVTSYNTLYMKRKAIHPDTSRVLEDALNMGRDDALAVIKDILSK